MVGLGAPDKVDLTFTCRVDSIQPDTAFSSPVAPPAAWPLMRSEHAARLPVSGAKRP